MHELSLGMVVVKPNPDRFPEVALLVGKAFGKEASSVSKLLNLERLSDVVETLRSSVIVQTIDKETTDPLLQTIYCDKHREIGCQEWEIIRNIMSGNARYFLVISNKNEDSLNKALRALKGHCELVNESGCSVLEPYGIRGKYMPKSVLTADREEAVLKDYARGRIKSRYIISGCAGGGNTSVPTHYVSNGEVLRSMLDNFVHTTDTSGEAILLYDNLWPIISARAVLGLL